MRDAREVAHDHTYFCRRDYHRDGEHNTQCDETESAVIAARREAFEAGYRASLIGGADVDLTKWPMSVAWAKALERAGLKP